MMADCSTVWNQCETCTQCGLGLTAIRRSVGVGNPDSHILIVGDVPDFYHGDSKNFTPTPLGAFLNQMLSIIDLSLGNVYFTTLVKCVPYEKRQPMATEMEACRVYLRQQCALVNPKLIVCLGRLAAQALLSDDFKISRDHGLFTLQNGVHITAIYHPAALLRDPTIRPETFVDLKKIQSKLVELGEKV